PVGTRLRKVGLGGAGHGLELVHVGGGVGDVGGHDDLVLVDGGLGVVALQVPARALHGLGVGIGEVHPGLAAAGWTRWPRGGLLGPLRSGLAVAVLAGLVIGVARGLVVVKLLAALSQPLGTGLLGGQGLGHLAACGVGAEALVVCGVGGLGLAQHVLRDLQLQLRQLPVDLLRRAVAL